MLETWVFGLVVFLTSIQNNKKFLTLYQFHFLDGKLTVVMEAGKSFFPGLWKRLFLD